MKKKLHPIGATITNKFQLIMKTNKILPLIRLLCVAAIATALQVAAIPQLTLLPIADQGTNRVYSFSAGVTVGTNYRLQASTNLTAYNWMEVGSATAAGTNLLLSVTNAIATAPSDQFFRLVEATVISTNTVVTNGLLLATNLIINPGVTVSAPGDITINVTGATTLNGQIQAAGNLTLIAQGGMDVGANGLLTAGSNVIIVSSPSLIPTQPQMSNTFAADVGISTGNSGGGASLRGKPTQLPPITGGLNSKVANIWVDVGGILNVGDPNNPAAPPIVYPPMNNGVPGAADVSGVNANAKGANGDIGGGVSLSADEINFNVPVTFTSGNGGNGGDAKSAPSSADATATAGNGGNTGSFSFVASDGINLNAQVTLNFGVGGNGGNAVAFAANGGPNMRGYNATATGGNGGKSARSGTTTGSVQGLQNLVVNAQKGGQGGNASAYGGFGGADTNCPGTVGGPGGNATATAGNGGNATSSLTGGVAGSINPGPGGDAGNPFAAGFTGGNGHTCCNPPQGQPAGNGGKGGDATANVGNPGLGLPLGNVPPPVGSAGSGGQGGNGMGPGKGGGMGIGSPNPQVDNGSPGADGKVCPF